MLCKCQVHNQKKWSRAIGFFLFYSNYFIATVLISFSLFREPDNEVEQAAGSPDVKSDDAAKTEVPVADTVPAVAETKEAEPAVGKTVEQPAATTVLATIETKEADKAIEETVAPATQKVEEKVEEPLKPEAKAEAPMTEESTLQAIVDKTQASKAGKLPELESEGKGKHNRSSEAMPKVRSKS